MLFKLITNMKIILSLVVLLTILGCDNNSVEPTANSNSTTLSKHTPMRGSALSFDGVDDYVEVPDDPSLDLTDGFTITAWIYLEEYTEWASIVTKGGLPNGAGDANNYTIHQSGPYGAGNPDIATEFGHLRFTGSAYLPVPFPESSSIIPLHEWHFIAVTYDGTTLSFYYDGCLDGQYTLVGPLGTNDEPLHIGVDFPGGDEYWHGLIDELKIWNKPLKKVHINAAMHGHSSPLANALVGYWRFDEGEGNIAHDHSRFGNDGTLIGNPTWVSPGAPNP